MNTIIEETMVFLSTRKIDMKKIIALAAIAAACSTSAFAQVSNFTGPSVGINLSAVSTTTELTSEGNATLDGFGQQSFGTSLQAAYGFPLSNNTVVAVGGTYSLTKDKAGNLTLDNAVQFKAKNQMSLYVEPGFLVSNTTLAYGKLSYESAKVTAEAADGNGSQNIKGLGYGFGIRTMLNKNLSLQAEVKMVKYGAESFDGDTTAKFKTSATIGTIGLGYKF